MDACSECRRKTVAILGFLWAMISCAGGDEPAAPDEKAGADDLPCVRLVDEDGGRLKELDFGSLGSSEASRLIRVRLENCGDERPLRVESSTLTGAQGFSIRGLERTERRIDVGDSREVELIFRPPRNASPGLVEANWVVKAEGIEREVQLRGRLWDCPSFHVQVAAIGKGEAPARMAVLSKRWPMASAEILVDESRAQEILQWEWESGPGPTPGPALVVFNGGRNAHFSPQEPGYFSVNARGYHVEPGVVCLPDPRRSVGVHNSVGTDVMAVLSWEEERPDLEEGLPFELHYRNREGPWRDLHWDVFRDNPGADWGGGGRARMSHHQLGSGWWESTMHFDPASGDIIDVGVQLGAAVGREDGVGFELRAQIFVSGFEVVDYRRKLASQQRGWHIAQIQWPGVEGVDNVFQNLWEVP